MVRHFHPSPAAPVPAHASPGISWEKKDSPVSRQGMLGEVSGRSGRWGPASLDRSDVEVDIEGGQGMTAEVVEAGTGQDLVWV